MPFLLPNQLHQSTEGTFTGYQKGQNCASFTFLKEKFPWASTVLCLPISWPEALPLCRIGALPQTRYKLTLCACHRSPSTFLMKFAYGSSWLQCKSVITITNILKQINQLCDLTGQICCLSTVFLIWNDKKTHCNISGPTTLYSCGDCGKRLSGI